jgi:hypothetical protein
VRAIFTVSILLVVAAGAAGCHKDRCLTICLERQQSAGCGTRADCKASCTKLHTAPICQAELKKFEDCFLDVPKEQWICGADGLPVVPGTSCQSERGLVEMCFAHNAPVPPPKKP